MLVRGLGPSSTCLISLPPPISSWDPAALFPGRSGDVKMGAEPWKPHHSGLLPIGSDWENRKDGEAGSFSSCLSALSSILLPLDGPSPLQSAPLSGSLGQPPRWPQCCWGPSLPCMPSPMRDSSFLQPLDILLSLQLVLTLNSLPESPTGALDGTVIHDMPKGTVFMPAWGS